MKAIVLFLLLLVPAVGFEVDAMTDDELEFNIQKKLLLSNDNTRDYSWVTEEVRPLVIANLREKLGGNQDRASWVITEQVLLCLGDIPAIERFIENFREAGHIDNMPTLPVTDEAIALAMPFVHEGPKIYINNGDMVHPSIRDSFALVVLRIVKHRQSFPTETREWAKQMEFWLFQRNPEDRIDLLKLWWEKNRTAILEKRYADATWLPRYKGKLSYYSAEEMNERKADLEMERAAREAPRPETVGKSPVPQVEEKPAPWLWISICALAVLLAGIFLRRKLAAKAG